MFCRGFNMFCFFSVRIALVLFSTALLSVSFFYGHNALSCSQHLARTSAASHPHFLRTHTLRQATPDSAQSPASALDTVALLVEHLFALLDKDRAPFSLRAKQHAAFCARLLRMLHEKVRRMCNIFS